MAAVLVTGGTGFIGRHLVRHLLERGDRVRCLIHETEDRPAGAECVEADITRPETLAQVARGVDIVYHLAGATLVASAHRYKTINSVGTRNVGEVCARLTTPPTFVYLSSLAAAGPTAQERPRREEDPPAPVSEYGRSKLQGERYLRALAHCLPVTILRPAAVFGPGDVNTLKLFRLARWGVNAVPGEADQELSFIYVDDLVRALPQVAELGQRLGEEGPRGVYFMAMEDGYSLRELGQLAGHLQGRAGVRTVMVPPPVARIVGRANDFLARLTMQPIMLTSDKIREALAGSWLCSSAKARHEWGFACGTSMADGFSKTVSWYRQQGWL